MRNWDLKTNRLLDINPNPCKISACRPWRPRHALPRGRSRERSTPILLGVALYRSTLRRRCLAGDPCLDAAARPSTARWHSASPRMRRVPACRGKLQECFVLLAGEVQAIRVTAWLVHARVEGCVQDNDLRIGSAVSCGTCCDKLAAIKEYGNVI